MDGTPRTSGMGRALFNFAMAMIAGQVAILGIGLAFPDFDLPSSTGMIIIMAASIAAGQSFAKVADRVMTGGEKARFALAATAISLAVTAAFYIGLFAYYRVPFSMDNLAMMFTGDPGLAADLKNWLVIILAVATVLTWVVSWFFVGMGAKGAIKARDKLAAKQGRV
ncbi:MAG: hypothetical protein IPL38_07215 [Rhodobacter sp.]|jgi:hypothetical protein|nr:hypothetical protein [Rhodobacter sp.]MBK8439303.1 hypothetical protein [Rhodobacter sp.]